MLKLTSDPKFTHTVKVMVPVDGGHTEQSLKVTYRVIDVADIGDTGDLEGQQALLRRIVCGFDDLLGDDDQPLPYSDELRERMIAVPYIRGALTASYVAAVTKTKVGN